MGKKLDEALKDADLKAEIEEYAEEKAKGLKDKNSELLGEVKDLKGKVKKASETQTELQQKLDDAEESLGQQNKDVQAQIDQATKPFKRDLEKAQQNAADATGRLSKLTIAREMSSALTKAKIAGPMQDAVRALIQADHKVEVVDKDGNQVVQIDGKDASAFVTEWAGTDTGKNFIAASGNGGGGAQGAGSGGTSGGKQKMLRTDFEALSPVEQGAAVKSHQIVDAL